MTLRRTRKQVGGKSVQHIQSLIKPSISPCTYSCHSPCIANLCNVYVVISFVLEFDHFGRMRRACIAPTLRQSVRWMDKTAAQFSQTEAPRVAVAFTFNRKIVFSFIGPDLQIKLVAWIRGQHKPLIIDTSGSQCLPKSEATEAGIIWVPRQPVLRGSGCFVVARQGQNVKQGSSRYGSCTENVTVKSKW